mmetsp:Transcript_20574/g.60766  ORF Transcript_20574/g.60766 Transcript_20574/m.60766 type:complete len:213 (+) Transcript_20574:445-1083(+)
MLRMMMQLMLLLVHWLRGICPVVRRRLRHGRLGAACHRVHAHGRARGVVGPSAHVLPHVHGRLELGRVGRLLRHRCVCGCRRVDAVSRVDELVAGAVLRDVGGGVRRCARVGCHAEVCHLPDVGRRLVGAWRRPGRVALEMALVGHGACGLAISHVRRRMHEAVSLPAGGEAGANDLMRLGRHQLVPAACLGILNRRSVLLGKFDNGERVHL